MRKWLIENWFKVGIILIGIWIGIFSVLIFSQLRILADIDSNTSDTLSKTADVYNSVSEELPGIHADLDSIDVKINQ